ncbi:UDP-N-acetylmuramoyl-L-alanine--D-glutamate ligase, partial [Alphaproteobacteria bacterium]|nr:UDP-N-acetylmuramoyl-L-alanine--D-glutamate ligase [Alphaproteobacteria bacterium]
SLSLNNKQIELAIKTFKGLPHRLEPIYSSKKIKIVNDSKATNGESSSAALKSFKNIFWIAGGEAKSDGIGAALSCLENVLKIFLIGKSSNLFYEQISTVNKDIPIIKCKTLDRAIALAIDRAKNSELDHIIILLSPAAASFDQYINFEERGNKFKRLVQKHYQKKSLAC